MARGSLLPATLTAESREFLYLLFHALQNNYYLYLEDDRLLESILFLIFPE